MLELDFIGIGVHRSGTTWTWKQLVKHPKICTTPKEASNFLPEHPDKVPFRFQKNIPYCYRKCKKNKKVGEYTPSYLCSPTAMQRIETHSPNSKLLLLLRNPIDRIQTQFKVNQWIEYGQVIHDFTYWFKNPKPMPDMPLYIRSPHRANNYVEWLRPWMKTFGDQLQISLYDDIVKDPLKYIQKCYKHIGVDNTFVPPNYEEREKKDYNFYFESNPFRITPEQRLMVKTYYRSSILELQDLIQRDLSDWLK